MEPSDEAAVPAGPKDYSGRLRGFGIFLIVLAGLHFLQMCLSLVSLVVVGFAAASTGTEISAFSFFSPLISVWSGVLSLILGIGSCQAKRWARPFILIRSWYSLGTTVLGIPLMYVGAKAGIAAVAQGQPEISSSLVFVIVLVLIAGIVAIQVGISLLFIWAFQPDGLRLTCEVRHPSPCWTDRIPIPLLGYCIHMIFTAAIWLAIPFAYDVPFFGTFLSRPAGFAFGLLMGGAYLLLTWKLAQRRISGLIGSAVLAVLNHAFGVTTLALCGIAEVFEHMRIALPEAQKGLILQVSTSMGGAMVAYVVLLGIANLVFLFWIRRYFVSAPGPLQPPPSPPGEAPI
jgi:hypothetical protein